MTNPRQNPAAGPRFTNIRGYPPVVVTTNISFEAFEAAPFLTEDDLPAMDDRDLIRDFNMTFALVIVGDKAVVMVENDDGGIDFWTSTTFEQWFANRYVTLRTGKKMPAAKYWLRSIGRRQYRGLVFSPNRDQSGYYNLWRGLAVSPRRGDCSKFLGHIKDNVCGGNEDINKWVIGWFADIVQHPAKKIGTSLVLCGKQGCGKTIVGKIFGSLLGSHYFLMSDPRMVTGRFNSHLTSCLLLHADEGFSAEDRAAVAKLRDLVTGDYQNIEFKGKEVIRIRSYVRLLVTSNEDFVFPASLEERRPAILEVGDGRMQDHKYFGAIEDEADNGGREALLHHLLNFDLKSVNLRQIPKTDALLDQKIRSLNPEAAWWFDVLSSGELPAGCDEARQCPTEVLFNGYIRHASRQGARRRSIEDSTRNVLEQIRPRFKEARTTNLHPSQPLQYRATHRQDLPVPTAGRVPEELRDEDDPRRDLGRPDRMDEEDTEEGRRR